MKHGLMRSSRLKLMLGITLYHDYVMAKLPGLCPTFQRPTSSQGTKTASMGTINFTNHEMRSMKSPSDHSQHGRSITSITFPTNRSQPNNGSADDFIMPSIPLLGHSKALIGQSTEERPGAVAKTSRV